ncbi:MAG: hypothetical protein H0U80_01335 [Solirubrobacterales bacterium]|nr:hypothetical protein [Solirubrobacterales bacterium]
MRRALPRQIAQEEPAAVWVLEDGSEILGHPGVMETHARGVLSMFVAIVAEGRGRQDGSLRSSLLMARSVVPSEHA